MSGKEQKTERALLARMWEVPTGSRVTPSTGTQKRGQFERVGQDFQTLIQSAQVEKEKRRSAGKKKKKREGVPV